MFSSRQHSSRELTTTSNNCTYSVVRLSTSVSKNKGTPKQLEVEAWTPDETTCWDDALLATLQKEMSKLALFIKKISILYCWSHMHVDGWYKLRHRDMVLVSIFTFSCDMKYYITHGGFPYFLFLFVYFLSWKKYLEIEYK